MGFTWFWWFYSFSFACVQPFETLKNLLWHFESLRLACIFSSHMHHCILKDTLNLHFWLSCIGVHFIISCVHDNIVFEIWKSFWWGLPHAHHAQFTAVLFYYIQNSSFLLWGSPLPICAHLITRFWRLNYSFIDVHLLP